jgi:PAS domain S-box-containing protein
MTTEPVATSTWSVGRKTLAAFVAISAIVLVAPASIYLAATHYVEANRQLRRTTEAASAYEQLRSAYAVLSIHRGPEAAAGDGNFGTLGRAAGALEKSLGLLEAYPQAAAIPSARLKELRADIERSLRSADQQRTEHLLTTIDRHLATTLQLHVRRTSDAEQAALWLHLTIGICAVLMLIALAWLLSCIRRDLLEREWFERQLQDTNSLLESLFENMPAMVFAKDARTLKFVRINRLAEKIMGYSREEMLGRNDYDFFPKEQADQFTAKDRETLAGVDIVEIPHEQIDTGDHGRRTLHTLKVPIRGTDGQPLLLLGISLDITQEKEAERRVVALNEELTRQTELLQSSNEELESFCYSVSHDLRAPLRAINGFARLLEQEYGSNFDPQGTRYVRTICNACSRMAQLIDDLLEFARIGRQTLEREPLDMSAMVSKAVSDAVAGRAAPVPVIETDELPWIDGDRTLLQLVWLNLIDNAVKYTSGVAAPHIRIAAERRSDEVVYCVSDNGIGFDMQYADKLFGVFQRLHSNAEYPGTGVGLAIAQRIVERHGGRIWARSEPEQGSTFSFSLPAKDTA